MIGWIMKMNEMNKLSMSCSYAYNYFLNRMFLKFRMFDKNYFKLKYEVINKSLNDIERQDVCYRLVS